MHGLGRRNVAATRRRVNPTTLGGFTLLELVLVLTIISILSATAVISTRSTSQRAAVEAADKLRRDVAHIQALGMSYALSLRLTAAADGSGYNVTCRSIATFSPCTTLGASLIDPATGSAFSITFTDGVTISASSATLDFDSMGRPIAGTALLTANPAVTYTLTGSGTTAIVHVRPLTGFAEIG